MHQPELGQKVAELRQHRGLTQEQLAEACEVSTRTIQRIESGEVDPRSYTLKMLGEALDFEFIGASNQNEANWLLLLHLSSVINIVFIPLLIWSLKKEHSPTIDRHGKDVLNFQITMTLAFIGVAACAVLSPLIGILAVYTGANIRIGVLEIVILGLGLPSIALGFFIVYQGIANTIRVVSGKPYHYPLSIPFVK